MNLAHLSDQEIKETLVLKERLELLKNQAKCQDSFLEYVNTCGQSLFVVDITKSLHKS